MAAFLHENYTHFVDESSIEDVAEAAAHLSDAGEDMTGEIEVKG